MTSFIAELKRRNVVRAGVAYAIVAWLLVEIASTVLPTFGTPEWVLKAFTFLVILGLPLVLLFAWAFELTPEGLKRTEDVPVDSSITPTTGRKLDFVIIGVMAVALVYFISTHDWSGDKAEAPDRIVVAQDQKSVAVLPFANLSEHQANAFFASGIHEDILTYLTKVRDLHVISRTSVLQYADVRPDLRQIAEELGVNYVVEGSVRRAGDRVRVTAQLVDASNDKHLWADNFDRDLTDIFEIQTAVAKEIVTALKANLSEAEQRAIEQQPTESIDAYDFYLRAREFLNQPEYSIHKFQAAQPLLEEAVAIDPDFALAHTALAGVHGQAYWLQLDRSPARVEAAKRSIDRAFQIDPDLPEARAALGNYYYRMFQDYKRALEQQHMAHARMPSDAMIVTEIGMTQRRLAMWHESIDSFGEAAQLDPANLNPPRLQIETLLMARRPDEAGELLEQYIARYPGEDALVGLNAQRFLSYGGDTDAAWQTLSTAKPDSTDLAFRNAKYTASLNRHDFESALAVAQSFDTSGESPGITALLEAEIYMLMGEEENAAESLRSAAVEYEKNVAKEDPHPRTLASACLVHAYMRDRDLALEYCDRARDSVPAGKDYVMEPTVSVIRARALAVLGETEEALALIEHLLTVEGGLTQWDYYLDPAWDFMRDNERFVALTTPEGR